MSGDGVDIAAVYQLLSEVAKTRVFSMLEGMATKTELHAVAAELRADILSLQREVRTYHSSVVGHGITLTDHEDRIERLEHATGLPSPPP